MKFFLFVFEGIAFGMPMGCVAEFIQAPGNSGTLIGASVGDVFFSIPHFFGKGAVPAPHGIVLKSFPCSQGVTEALRGYAGGEVRHIVLLTTPIEREIDIPDETIRQLPAFLGLPGKLPFLTGVSFTGTTMTAYIDPQALVSCILRDVTGGSP
ncbi:MAG: hypothetical protein LBT14_08335 [Treponema sp.]|jgi:hypothetical protein|nr:hypothetical protein [Treponema sp.]